MERISRVSDRVQGSDLPPAWQSESYGFAPTGSLFTDETTAWNVAHLPNLLNRLKRKLPGVNTPYLYFGMWAATFAWHVEDVGPLESAWTCTFGAQTLT
jgi:hypothetical protein